MHNLLPICSRWGAWIALALVAFACDIRQPAGPEDLTLEVGEKHRGVNLVAGRSLPFDTFDPLVQNNVAWIAQTPFGWQRRFDDPEIEIRTSGVRWGETDAGLTETAAQASTAGIRTMLKPHIWLIEEVEGEWRGTIDFDTEADWIRWEDDYRAFILHYAILAEETGMEAFSLGVELRSAVLERPHFWDQLISEVRTVYSGQLTYGANWYREYEEIGFWSQLDFIGVHAYFPLTASLDPTVDELLEGWQPHLETLESLHRMHRKPILFTEIGYRSIDGATVGSGRLAVGWLHRPAGASGCLRGVVPHLLAPIMVRRNLHLGLESRSQSRRRCR